jgi:DamX protein
MIVEKNSNKLESKNKQTAANPAAARLSTADQPMRLEELAAELESHRDQLRDYEKDLVNRIADVDDDRRRNAAQLKRVWQSQRDEIEGRLRRQYVITAVSLFVMAVVVAVALFLVYKGSRLDRNASADAQVAEIKGELEQIPQIEARDELIQGKLSQLSARVEEISSTLAQLIERQPQTKGVDLGNERAAREAGDAQIAADLQRLEDEQRRVAQELEALQEAFQAARASPVAPGPDDSRPAPTAEPLTDDVAAPAAGAASALQRGDSAPVNASSPAAEMPATGVGEAIDAGEPVAGGTSSVSDPGETIVISDRPYAIQLIGFFSLRSLLDFAAREDLPPQVYYREESYQNRPWYVMIHSLYGSYESAAAELSRLPADLAGLDPWIRSMDEGTEFKVLDTGAGR